MPYCMTKHVHDTLAQYGYVDFFIYEFTLLFVSVRNHVFHLT